MHNDDLKSVQKRSTNGVPNALWNWDIAGRTFNPLYVSWWWVDDCMQIYARFLFVRISLSSRLDISPHISLEFGCALRQSPISALVQCVNLFVISWFACLLSAIFFAVCVYLFQLHSDLYIFFIIAYLVAAHG